MTVLGYVSAAGGPLDAAGGWIQCPGAVVGPFATGWLEGALLVLGGDSFQGIKDRNEKPRIRSSSRYEGQKKATLQI